MDDDFDMFYWWPALIAAKHGLKSALPDPRADYLFKIQAVGAESRRDKRRRQYAPADLVKVAAMHNLREIAKEFGVDSHIDVNRIKDNFIIAGEPTSAGVVAYEHQLLSDAGLPHKIRKNAVRAIEIVFSLKSGANVDYRAYFTAATKWAAEDYGVPVLSSVVHLDESFPHCHVLLFPSVVDGRLDGNALMGDVTKINHARSSFHKQVASPFGLKRQTTQKRLSAAVRVALAHSILSKIKASRDALNEPVIKDLMIELFAASPALLAAAMGIEVPQPDTIAFDENTIAFQHPAIKASSPANMQTLSCVSVSASAPVSSSSIEPDPDEYHDDITRIREDEQAVGYWNELGDCVPPPPPRTRRSSPAIEQAHAQIISLQARRSA